MTSADAWRAGLNPQQLAAVEAPDGPVLVLAAAGTGKTRTLTHRVARLVAEGVPPDRILLVTFTNRAAREMLERARGLAGEAVGGLWGGTFHHLANRLLRRHAPKLGYPSDYLILDTADAKQLMKESMASLGFKPRDFVSPEVIRALVSVAVNSRRPLEDLIGERLADSGADPADVLRVAEVYARRKQELGQMDFDDLLVNGLRLLTEVPAVGEGVAWQFRHVLVDEYQDTNPIQAEMMDRVASRHGNLFVVGDDFQSIYGWRGADFRNILSFPERYPRATVVPLTINYRSVPEVLEVANATMREAVHQFPKTMEAVREAYRRPVRVTLWDGQAQARFVVARLRALLREGYRPHEIAVLYRSHFQALETQMELQKEQMPFLMLSGLRFYEQAHIKDVCALPRLLASPRDDLAFRRLLGLLPRVGAKTADTLWTKVGREFNPGSAVDLERLVKALPAAAREIWAPVHEGLAKHAARGGEPDPGGVIETFLDAFYGGFLQRTYDNAPRRLDDIRELVNQSAAFGSGAEFLHMIALQSNLEDAGDVDGGGGPPPVTLSTIHQAKGLEWKAVIVLWLAEGMFPAARSIAESGDDAEERRLFYVAATRAQDELYLCVPRTRRLRDGGVLPLDPSRFVEELPKDTVDRVESGPWNW